MKKTLVAAALAALTVVVARAASQAPPQNPQGRGAAVFPAQQRPPADPALVERGRAVFSVTCSACHGADARGGQLGGPNLLRSQVVLDDREGELILPIVHGARASKGMPALNLPDADVKAIAAYLHSLQASGGGQGAPPPHEGPPPNIVVGDAAAGEKYFAAQCSACHSPTGDLQGVATRVADPKTLQNLWVSGGVSAGGRGGGRRGGSPAPNGATTKVTVTRASGETIQGRLLGIDDFIVTLAQADGSIRSVRRDGNRTKVTVDDPLKAHRDLLAVYTEKDIHDVTAYLVTLK